MKSYINTSDQPQGGGAPLTIMLYRYLCAINMNGDFVDNRALIDHTF